MNKQTPLLPAGNAEHTAEALITGLSGGVSLVYTITLLLFCIGLPLLLLMKIDIVVRATGILKSPLPKQSVVSLGAGHIEQLYIKEYQQIQKGDTLLKISNSGLYGNISATADRKEELQVLLEDLTGLKDLCEKDSVAPLVLITDLYTRAYAHYSVRYRELELKCQEVYKTWLRMQHLYKEQVVTSAEYDASESAYRLAQTALSGHYQSQMQLWQADQLSYQKELQEVSARLQTLQTEQNGLWVIAPVTGNISKIAGISVGSPVIYGQELFEISPSEALLAECLVPAAQIGFIHSGQAVKISAEAFPHTQWGMISGAVQTISPDSYNMGSPPYPYFKLLCSMDQLHLSLKNGQKVALKKGMNVQVRMLLCKKRIFQLLYEKTNQWINPKLISQ